MFAALRFGPEGPAGDTGTCWNKMFNGGRYESARRLPRAREGERERVRVCVRERAREREGERVRESERCSCAAMRACSSPVQILSSWMCGNAEQLPAPEERDHL